MNPAPCRSRRSAVVTTVAGLTVCGALLGVVWSRVAPPIHTITALTKAGEQVDAFLGKEADNLFVAAAMMVGLLSALAVVSAVAVWQCRPHRGPVLAAALWIGQVAAAAAATGVGALLAHARYGTPDRTDLDLSPTDRVRYFTEAPPVFFGHNGFQIALTLLLPAALAALVYALLAVATPRDDLGGWPPQHGLATAAGTAPAHPA